MHDRFIGGLDDEYQWEPDTDPAAEGYEECQICGDWYDAEDLNVDGVCPTCVQDMLEIGG